MMKKIMLYCETLYNVYWFLIKLVSAVKKRNNTDERNQYLYLYLQWTAEIHLYYQYFR